MPQAEQMLRLFPCSRKSFAWWRPDTLQQDERGKLTPKYVTERRAVTAADWQEHLAGRCAVVLPLGCDDGTAQVTIIDVDQYDLDLPALMKKVKLSGLPLYVGLSKSGGPHITTFHDVPITIEDSARLAQELARRLGLSKYEVFPRPQAGTLGLDVNMPYFGGERGYLRLNLEQIPLDEFLTTVVKLTAEQRAELLKTASSDDGDGSNFANMMLERYRQQIATEMLGGRNHLINKAAWYLATMAARGWIGEDRIEDELMAATEAAGWDNERHTRDTVRRAIKAGLEEPHEDLRKYYVTNTTAVMDLNRDYALVLAGDKAVVLNEEGRGFRLLAVSAFSQWLSNRFVTFEDDKGEDKCVPLAKYWLNHSRRRQYSGLIFKPNQDVPGAYNLWQGFAVKPVQGDCSRLLVHLRDNVCQGNAALYQWVMAWWADIIQRPTEKCGTSLALRGKPGVGKTIVGKYFGSLLGPHYVLAPEPRYVIGRFNSHLAACLLLHAEEGFWAGDKTAEGKIKDMITGTSHWLEYKGKEAIWIDNYMRLFVTSNENWVVPATLGERRFGVLDVGEAHREDHPYFAAIDYEMRHGGSEALLYHLLHKVDCSAVNLRQIPQTVALLQQKVASMTPEQMWWLDVLTRGVLPGDYDGDGTSLRKAMYEHYIARAKDRGVARRVSDSMLGMLLKTFAPPTQEVRATIGDRRERARVFPPLSECRKKFAELLQAKRMIEELNWEEGEWTADEVPGAEGRPGDPGF
jgi:hypothetical protein